MKAFNPFNRLTMLTVASAIVLSLASGAAYAQGGIKGKSKPCKGLPTQAQLKNALEGAVSTSRGTNALNNEMWATIVNADGIVCAVAFSGANRSAQWLLSRVISAQKANTANGLSVPAGAGSGVALSTANLYTAFNPGGSLYGGQHSNPVDAEAAYQGNPRNFGRQNDPLVGEKVGGVNIFGGGLALYGVPGARSGGLGASGGTSCEDHIVAWRIRDALGLDNIPGGVASGTDNIIYDLTSIEASPAAAGANTGGFTSPSGFGHPTCGGDADGPGDGDVESLGQALPGTNPIGP